MTSSSINTSSASSSPPIYEPLTSSNVFRSSPSTSSGFYGIDDTNRPLIDTSSNVDYRAYMDFLTRMHQLYPYTEESELPQSWSTKDKAPLISLSDNNLRVHYKGSGRKEKEDNKNSASVRANQSIPQSCLIYYFEVKLISKGRNGYIGVGLSADEAELDKLPGWPGKSFGYHGDDGNAFSGNGQGRMYGPTYGVDDIIGCGYNLVENSCFYTKNGLNLGAAFTNLPHLPLYPTVGLKTHGEEVEANFGQRPFRYDIEQDLRCLRKTLTTTISNYPINYTEWQTTLHKLVQSWLIHNSYPKTAEVFSRSTKLDFNEDLQTMKHRLRIQNLVMAGKISDAIRETDSLNPNVLRDNHDLLFALKCRQFIEMIMGNESDTGPVLPSNGHSVATNGVSTGPSAASDVQNNFSNSNGCPNQQSLAETMDVDQPSNPNDARLLMFGRELRQMSLKLKRQFGKNETNKQMLMNAFSLMAYADPKESPDSWLLEPSEREPLCQLLNSAIVKAQLGGSNQKPPLESIVKHIKVLLKLNSSRGAWLVDKL